MNGSCPVIPIAFVDVDETLVRDITFLSMFVFDAERRDRGAEAASVVEQFHALRASGMTRAQSHRWFYRHWAGREVADVRLSGQNWFAARAAAPEFFNDAVRQRLDGLVTGGTRIVLVSGSVEPALHPIAESVGASAVLCTTLETRDGRYTGEVIETMVGADKSSALRRYCTRQGIALRSCAAFGDHHSDISMFDLVGHPVVVGTNDPLLDTYPALRLPG